jgi:hypothetical protein
MISGSNPFVVRHRRDICIVLLLAALSGFGSFYTSQLVDPVITQYETEDSWFEADIARVFHNMSSRGGNHYRTKVHPLFSLIAGTPVIFLKKLFGLRPAASIRFYIAIVASLWISALYILLRIIGCQRLDSWVFSLLAMSSSAAMFWFAVPAWYCFGSLSILLALLIVSLSRHRNLSHWWYVGASAFSLSFTSTNWMAGILATFANYPWKRALQITVNAFALVTLLWGIQKFIFPSASFFIGDKEETSYILKKESGGPFKVASSFFFHSIVMPEIQVVDKGRSEWPLMLTQNSRPGSGSQWGLFSVGIWAVLLVVGCWKFLRLGSRFRLRFVIAFTILGQLGLHILYGEETFLYALHFAPVIIVMVAISTLTSARLPVLILTSILVLCAGINNAYQFKDALAFLRKHGNARHQVKAQMRVRPGDPWPRGVGHVVLSIPGSREEEKAYHEPGGSFSPAVNSFGISIWITDAQGKLRITSDEIPLTDIIQRLSWSDSHVIPAITTQTTYYEAEWRLIAPGHWILNFAPALNVNSKPMVVVRSVGPAGGPVGSLSWTDESLLINERWTLKIKPMPLEVHLGDETRKDWLTEDSTAKQWMGRDGWGYARLILVNDRASTLVINDNPSPPSSKLNYNTLRSSLKIDLPDQRFVSCLEAQVAHLMMSLVDGETRPGDPMNYPLSWLRDGAYVIVALARAGRLEMAKELSLYLAENDFFGGFGAEADAPGLALWALEEVAVRMNESEFDQQLWPHIDRKAKLIIEMLSAESPIYKPAMGPIVPSLSRKLTRTTRWARKHGGLWPYLVAEPVRDGLIIGKMDDHFPLLFVNAVSYRGLIAAASFAERNNHDSSAAYWRAKAEELQQAWIDAFKPPESLNSRTYICGLWPTWIATFNKDQFYQGLLKRWTDLRDTKGRFRDKRLWTYFDIAEAHQWLFLGQPDRVWSTLNWFWNNQASPGLYSWWEGNGETNTYHR